jgi:lipid-A-disaccharide synthase
MKKIFIVAGELSGDQTGSWYLKKLLKDNNEPEVTAVGGNLLKNSGAKIYERIEKLNIAGVVEVLGKLKFIFSFLKKLTKYIIDNNFDEVILVDFPGFNLMLAKKLKKINPKIRITYLSPPQLWVWGSWRVKKLKKYCDKLIVNYPFEVDWYKKHGIESVEYLGNSSLDRLQKYLDLEIPVKNQIAILPGSREQEIIKLLPMFSKIIKKVKLLYPEVRIVLPVAQSINVNFLENELRKNNLYNHGKDVFIITDPDEKLKAMKESCLAITKPGTITLELALLNVPSVIFYKVSWISYFLAKLVANVKYMGLPNLFLKKEVFKEFVQGDCKADLIFIHIKNLYESFLKKDNNYKSIKVDLEKIKSDFYL